MHKRIEAMKLACSDIHRYNADPRTYDAPVARLLSREYAKQRAALINPARANCNVEAGLIRAARCFAYSLDNKRATGAS